MKYPDITVNLVGEDGNAFAILGRVSKALRRAGVPAEQRRAARLADQAGALERRLGALMRSASGTRDPNRLRYAGMAGRACVRLIRRHAAWRAALGV